MSKPKQRYLVEMTVTSKVRIEMLANSRQEAQEKLEQAYWDGAYDDEILQNTDTKEKYIKISKDAEIDFDFTYDEHNFYDGKED